MSERPYVLLSCAASVDGYIDDATGERCFCPTMMTSTASMISAPAATRSWWALPPSARTTRACWCARHPGGQRASAAASPRARSRSPSPAAGSSNFFTIGNVDKIVYAAGAAADKSRERLGNAAIVVDCGSPLDLQTTLTDLAASGVRRLMVEGGGTVHTQFLTAGLADEIQLVIAPFFVGDPAAPRFVGSGRFPHDHSNRMALAETRQIGDVILARYLLGSR